MPTCDRLWRLRIPRLRIPRLVMFSVSNQKQQLRFSLRFRFKSQITSAFRINRNQPGSAHAGTGSTLGTDRYSVETSRAFRREQFQSDAPVRSCPKVVFRTEKRLKDWRRRWELSGSSRARKCLPRKCPAPADLWAQDESEPGRSARMPFEANLSQSALVFDFTEILGQLILRLSEVPTEISLSWEDWKSRVVFNRIRSSLLGEIL